MQAIKLQKRSQARNMWKVGIPS